MSGASRGIGAEIASQLAADHGLLVLAGHRKVVGAPAAEGEDAPPDGVVPVQLDVTDQASVDAVRHRIDSDPGRLDVLVNNAGVYGPHDPIAEFDLEEAHRVLETNTFGALRLAQAMAPLLRASDDARIVNVSSGAGQLDDMNGGSIGYRMSKAALNAVTKVLAAEEEGIRANSICPGWVATDMGGSGAPRSVAEGADTAVWLATDLDVASGGFYRNREPIPW